MVWFWNLYEKYPRHVAQALSFLVSAVIIFALFFTGTWITNRAQAATGGGALATCELWADIKPWSITRCQGEWGEVCFLATSGMMACTFD